MGSLRRTCAIYIRDFTNLKQDHEQKFDCHGVRSSNTTVTAAIAIITIAITKEMCMTNA